MSNLTIVAALSQGLQFLSDSQDVVPIKQYVGEQANDYDAFFVRVQDGEYIEVWGMCGIIPYASKLVLRLL